MIFIKNFKFLKKKNHFILFYFIFLCYYCYSRNIKRQSEHSGLRPDTSSLVNFIEKRKTKDQSVPVFLVSSLPVKNEKGIDSAIGKKVV